MSKKEIKERLVDSATVHDAGLGEVTIMDIDPAWAATLLANLSNRQRFIRPKVVKRYASDMAAGLWHSNGEPFQLDRDLAPINGQHRLMAVIESGVTLKSQVVIILNGANVPKGDDAILTIDQGAARHLTDMQKVTGATPMSRSMSGAILAEHFQWQAWRDVSNQERIRILRDFEPDLKDDLSALEHTGPRRGTLFTVGSASAAIRCLRKNRESAMQFFQAVFAFDHIVYGEPNPYARMLYLFLQSRKSHLQAVGGTSSAAVVDIAYKTLRAWNAWRGSEEITKLQAPRVAILPMIEALE